MLCSKQTKLIRKEFGFRMCIYSSMRLVYGKHNKLYYDSKVSTTTPTECRSFPLGLLSILHRNFTLKCSCKVDGFKVS